MDLLTAVIVAILAVAVVLEFLMISALARQIGHLHERLADGNAHGDAASAALGAPAPDVPVFDAAEEEVLLGDLLDGSTAGILFASSSCGACTDLLDDLARSTPGPNDRDDLIVILPDPHSAERIPALQSLAGARTYTDRDGRAERTYGARSTPWLAVVHHGHLAAQGPVRSASELHQMFEEARNGTNRSHHHAESLGGE